MHKKLIADLFRVMADVVFDEIAKHDTIARTDLVDVLDLKRNSYPKHAATQGETS